jgi:DNA-binding transcriptional MerR regulator
VGTVYRVRGFATLAGVTVKTLYHYDRLGLLKPRRTAAGYRIYVESDLARLEQIVALKYLGFPLKQIRQLLDRIALELPDALRLQRTAMEARHERLGRAIRAIAAAEEAIQAGRTASPDILRTIIEAIGMQDDIDAMKKYYSEAAWEKHRRYYREGPSPEWKALYRDVAALLGSDPASDKAQRAADRWLDLSVRSYLGDPDVQTDSPAAWADRHHWPEPIRRRIAEFKLEEIRAFIEQAALSARRKYFADSAWEKMSRFGDWSDEEHSRIWQESVDLCRDIRSALDEDPSSDRAQDLLKRWTAQIEQRSGGDPEVRSGLVKMWADRRGWSPTLRWQMEGVHLTSYDCLMDAADFIDRAREASGGGHSR